MIAPRAAPRYLLNERRIKEESLNSWRCHDHRPKEKGPPRTKEFEERRGRYGRAEARAEGDERESRQMRASRKTFSNNGPPLSLRLRPFFSLVPRATAPPFPRIPSFSIVRFVRSLEPLCPESKNRTNDRTNSQAPSFQTLEDTEKESSSLRGSFCIDERSIFLETRKNTLLAGTRKIVRFSTLARGFRHWPR